MLPIRISIIEDSEIHAEWIRASFEDDENFKIVHCTHLARMGIEAARLIPPDVAIIDFQLKELTGLEVAKRLKARHEETKVFMITAHTEISIIERIFTDKNIDALAIKGSQYFDANLKSATKNVFTGGHYLDPSLFSILRAAGNNGISDLTSREFEIFIQSGAGKPDERIAADLCVELAYIRNTKSKIAKKINDTNLDNLLRKLIENLNPATMEGCEID